MQKKYTLLYINTLNINYFSVSISTPDHLMQCATIVTSSGHQIYNLYAERISGYKGVSAISRIIIQSSANESIRGYNGSPERKFSIVLEPKYLPRKSTITISSIFSLVTNAPQQWQYFYFKLCMRREFPATLNINGKYIMVLGGDV
jgi:hypothetical protein